MNYNNKTNAQLIVIIGERDSKIEELLALLETKTVELGTFNNNIIVLQNGIDEKDALIDELNKKLDGIPSQAAQIAVLETQLKQRDERIASLLEDEQQAVAIITDLKAQVDEANVRVEAATDSVMVVHQGKNFEVLIKKFNHNGVIYDAADLKNNPQIVKELIEENLGILKEKK